MEFENKTRGTLTIHRQIFEKLHQEIVHTFSAIYQIKPSSIIDYQLYGFNDYDPSKPSIKMLLDDKTGLYLNGKYLYQKWRQFKQGEKLIKFSREYSYAFFHSLGYKDLDDYLARSTFLTPADISAQNTASGKIPKGEKEEFYVGYYLGENEVIIKTALSISIPTSKVIYDLYYWEENNLVVIHYAGKVIDVKNYLTIFFSKEDSQTRRDSYVSLYYGNENLQHKPFLKGLYAGYDKFDQPVCGEVFFQRVDSRELQDELVRSPSVHPIIENYLVGKRFQIEHRVPQTLEEISAFGSQANAQNAIVGTYHGLMSSLDDDLEYVDIMVSKSGKLELKLPNTSFIGYVSFDKNTFSYTCIAKNKSHRLNITIKNTRERDGSTLGYFSGAMDHFRLSCGTLCFFSDTEIEDTEGLKKELHDYKDHQTNRSFSVQFQKMMANVRKGLNENAFPTISNDRTGSFPINHLEKIAGAYRIVWEKEQEDPNVECWLQLEPTGSATMLRNDDLYEGTCHLNGGVLAINFSICNRMPNFSQVLIFTGKYSYESADYFSGSGTYLDQSLKPACDTLFVIPKNKYDDFVATSSLGQET